MCFFFSFEHVYLILHLFESCVTCRGSYGGPGICTFTCQNSVPGAGVTEKTDQLSLPCSRIFCVCLILVLCNSYLCQAAVLRRKTLENARSF